MKSPASPVRQAAAGLLSLLAAAAIIVGGLLTPPAVLGQEKKTVQDVYNESVKLFEAGQFQQALGGFQTVLKYQPNFVYARSYAAKCIEAIKQGQGAARPTLEAGLANLVLPSVSFEGTSLGMVMEYLTQKSEELSGGKAVANFIYKGTDEQKNGTTVTLSLRNAPFREVLRYVGQLTNTQFKYEEFAIVATPAGSAVQATPALAPASQPAQPAESKFDPPVQPVKDPFSKNP